MTFPASLAQTLNDFHLQPYPSFTGVPQPITLRSVVHFLGALAWAWLLLVSFTGWGRAAGKFLRTSRLPASVACTVGIAVIIFLGGWLNLVHAIYFGVLYTLVGIGLIFYFLFRGEKPEAYRLKEFWNRTPSWSRLLIAIALLILIFRVAATVRLSGFDGFDDGPAYLVFPQKMLNTHSFASDPFSDRRVISSIGGSYLLQAFVISATSLAHIGMADRTLGLILLFFALFDLGIRFGLRPPQIAVMELIVALIPQETSNLTFSILPIVLLLSIVWSFLTSAEEPKQTRWRYAVTAGMAAGVVISLKSIYLPYAGALTLFPCLFLLWKKKGSQAVSLPLIAGAAAFAVMFTWMLAMKHASGTYFFPVLGHGVDYSSYHLFGAMPRFSSNRALVRVFLQGAVLLVLAGMQYVLEPQGDRATLSLGVLIAAAVAITAFNYESGGDYIWRYNFPQFFTAILVFFAAAASTYNWKHAVQYAKAKAGYILAILALIGCIFYYDFEGGRIQPFRQMKSEMHMYPRNLQASLSGLELVSPATARQYRFVETALPNDATALENTADAFLLVDGDRRTIFLDDWAGGASPPPGWPSAPDSGTLTRFLARNSVRYIVYGYDYASWADLVSCQYFANSKHFSQLDHALQRLTLITHHQFQQLQATHHLVYDDGKIAVIDLQSPTTSASLTEKPWTLDTDEGRMCLQILARYRATHPSNINKNNLYK